MDYDLELDRVCNHITEHSFKCVCVQLPDGLKPRADSIVDSIKKKTGVEVVIWMGSCYGACDIPLQVENLGVDLLIQWGHAPWV